MEAEVRDRNFVLKVKQWFSIGLPRAFAKSDEALNMRTIM
jgi:hypothetical protein